jgi:hypothetical protein
MPLYVGSKCVHKTEKAFKNNKKTETKKQMKKSKKKHRGIQKSDTKIRILNFKQQLRKGNRRNDLITMLHL